MKVLLAVLPLLIFATTAEAAPKHTSTRMSCESVQATLRDHGTVVLTYPSARRNGQMLYDTYVASRRFCRLSETAERVNVPTANRLYCPVFRCKPTESRDRRDPDRPDRGPNDPTRP